MVPSLRVAEREGLGFVTGGEEWVSLASDLHCLWNASPASRAYFLSAFSHFRPSTEQFTTFSNGIQSPRVKLTFKAVPQAPGGVPLHILPRMKDHGTSLRRVHLGIPGGVPAHLNVSHDSLSVLSDYRSSAPDQVDCACGIIEKNLEPNGEKSARQCQSKSRKLLFWKVTICIHPGSALRDTWTR
jgi:hypothetical protein